MSKKHAEEKAQKLNIKLVSRKNGGARHKAGRPPGSKNKATKELQEAKRIFTKRILKSITPLINSQLTIAKGCSFLFRLKTGKNDSKKPELITSRAVIESYLSGELENVEDEYYYITTKEPDNRAIDSMIDRVFGRATQKIVGDDDEDAIKVNILKNASTEDLNRIAGEKGVGET